jgi:hypothetical protein
VEAYLDIVDVLVKKCPVWAEYYKGELKEAMPLVEARRIGRSKKK